MPHGDAAVVRLKSRAVDRHQELAFANDSRRRVPGAHEFPICFDRRARSHQHSFAQVLVRFASERFDRFGIACEYDLSGEIRQSAHGAAFE
jgi:hypothetical protein